MVLDAGAEMGWAALGRFLERDLFLVGSDARRALLGVWDSIARAEAEIDDRLCVGLVGGTGVGKSTLVNALAGAEISVTGPRRPTTDLVVAYRHRRTPIPPAFPREHLAVPEVEHERPALERVILLDFPDFDSVEAAHGEILAACLPHLDVLLLLADDMKYADETLFELLGRLSQSRENLYVVLNKIDRLERRYGEEAGSVVDGILEDLSEKLVRHAGIRLGRERFFAISAEAAFRGGARPGEFPRIVGLLEEYRAEKRRRAAKERNIDARKEALREEVRRAALDPARLERAERLLERVRARKAELESLLASIPTEVLSARERRALAREASREGAAAFGFPIDLFVAAGAALRRARLPSAGARGLAASRARAHYLPFIQGADDAVRELRVEARDLVPLARLGDPPGAPFAGGTDVSPELARAEAEFSRRVRAACGERPGPRFARHALPAAVVAGYLWWTIYPAARAALEALVGVEGASWGSAVRRAVFGLFAGLHPLRLLGLAAAVVAAYALAALSLWGRRSRKVEAAAGEVEAELRERLREKALEGPCLLEAALGRWLAERDEARDLVGTGTAEGAPPRPGAASSG